MRKNSKFLNLRGLSTQFLSHMAVPAQVSSNEFLIKKCVPGTEQHPSFLVTAWENKMNRINN